MSSRFCSIWRISPRLSRRRTRACNWAASGGGGVQAGGWCIWQKRAISWASALSVLVRESWVAGEGFDLGRIDHGNRVSVGMEEAGQGIAVSAGGFQAGMNICVRRATLAAAQSQLVCWQRLGGGAWCLAEKDSSSAASKFALLMSIPRNMSDSPSGMSPLGLLLLLGASLVNASSSLRERLKILFDLCGKAGAGR